MIDANSAYQIRRLAGELLEMLDSFKLVKTTRTNILADTTPRPAFDNSGNPTEPRVVGSETVVEYTIKRK